MDAGRESIPFFFFFFTPDVKLNRVFRGYFPPPPVEDTAGPHQASLVARLVGVAHVHPQRPPPQGTVGQLHTENLVEVHDVLREAAAGSEQAAGGLLAGEHRHTNVPACDRQRGFQSGFRWSVLPRYNRAPALVQILKSSFFRGLTEKCVFLINSSVFKAQTF